MTSDVRASGSVTAAAPPNDSSRAEARMGNREVLRAREKQQEGLSRLYEAVQRRPDGKEIEAHERDGPRHGENDAVQQELAAEKAQETHVCEPRPYRDQSSTDRKGLSVAMATFLIPRE